MRSIRACGPLDRLLTCNIRTRLAASFIFFAMLSIGCNDRTQVANREPASTPNASMPPPPTPTSDVNVPTPPALAVGKGKVVAFGDSFTAGLGINDRRSTYPGLLQQDLDVAGYDLQVI